MNRPPLHRSAFTLIELLVVISIIALLVGILLPALASAREAGRNAVCLSNLRQIGIATYMYQNDFKGVFPGYIAVTRQLQPYLEADHDTTTALDGMLCPSALSKPTYVSAIDPNFIYGGVYTAQGPGTYGFNAHLQGGSGNPQSWFTYNGPRYRLQDVQHPGKTFWSVDASSSRFDYFFYHFSAPYRHGGNVVPGDAVNKTGAVGFNAVMLDGHASRIDWEEFKAWRLVSLPNPLMGKKPADPYRWW